MYQVSLKSEGVRPLFVITWTGITHTLEDQFATRKDIRISKVSFHYAILGMMLV